MNVFISSLIQRPQKFVDGIGMYRLVSGSLSLLALLSILSGFSGLLAYSGFSQLQAVVSAVVLALALNVAFAKLLQIHANHESAVITALILFFLVVPEDNFLDNWPLWLSMVIALLSKFLIVFRKQHIFNAAAFGAMALSATGLYTFSWWVGNPTLFVPVLLLGSLVVMKVRKWVPVLWFLGVGLAMYLFEAWRYGDVLSESLVTYFVSGPALFLAFFMLTEPFTMPPTKPLQAFYGGLVGGVSNTALFSTLFSMSPELALLLGNLIVYPFLLKRKLFLKLVERRAIAENTFEFIFKKPADMSFVAGQYLEWMLPHQAADSRGERRYFTIASAPTEDVLRLALKVVPNGGSTFKKHLLSLDVGQTIMASQLAGDFILPKDEKAKLGFIAGGIGVTPFRSHIQFMVDSGREHDTKLLYCCNSVAELAYQAEFATAMKSIALEVVPIIVGETTNETHERGFVTKEILERRVPDYLERVWYLSGPPPMVNSYSKLLLKLGVPKQHLVTDFFPGLA